MTISLLPMTLSLASPFINCICWITGFCNLTPGFEWTKRTLVYQFSVYIPKLKSNKMQQTSRVTRLTMCMDCPLCSSIMQTFVGVRVYLAQVIMATSLTSPRVGRVPVPAQPKTVWVTCTYSGAENPHRMYLIYSTVNQFKLFSYYIYKDSCLLACSIQNYQLFCHKM